MYVLAETFYLYLLNKKSGIHVNEFSFRIAEINNCKGALHADVWGVRQLCISVKKKLEPLRINFLI